MSPEVLLTFKHFYPHFVASEKDYYCARVVHDSPAVPLPTIKANDGETHDTHLLKSHPR